MKGVQSLMTCTNCRVIKYCSKSCQKSDWKHHKTWCAAFRSLCEEGSLDRAIKYESKEAFQEDVSDLMHLMLKKLGLFDHISEYPITASLPRCRKCHQACFRIHAETRKTESVKLTPCPRCMGVALCDACLGDTAAIVGEHTAKAFHGDSDTPQNACDEHLVALCCSGMIVEQGNPLGLPSSTDCTEYWNPKDWIAYFDKKRNDYEIPALLFNLAPVSAFITDSHSLVLTLQHVLGLPEMSEIIPDAKNLTHLVVHIVGATVDETSRPGRYVEMIRLNPSMVDLKLHFIGPETKVENVDAFLQQESIRPSCEVKLFTHLGLYHDVVEEEKLEAPSIVFCPHPGVHDSLYTDKWLPSMHYILERGYPLVMTGCNMKESRDDSQLLRQWGGSMIRGPTCNPFRGLRPLPDPSREFGDYFYSNASFVVFKGED